jgi:molybdenum cofactor synthesis domain-containing protein
MNESLSAIIIGNEVLTAKVAEANGAHVLKRCRERGVEVESVHFVRDDVDAIVEQVQACRRRARFVVTSGGVGPTHDDLTVRAVALALRREVVRLPELEVRIRGFYGERPVPAEALRMAEAPAGSTLLACEDERFPVLACERVFLLPGVPQLFRVHFEAVLGTVPGRPRSLRQLFLSVGEAEIASALDVVARARPHVLIGSYPTWGEVADHRVRLTIEHLSADETASVVQELERALPAGCIVRRE